MDDGGWVRVQAVRLLRVKINTACGISSQVGLKEFQTDERTFATKVVIKARRTSTDALAPTPRQN